MLTRCVSVIERAEAHRLSVMGDEKRVTIVVRKGENVSVIVSVEKPPQTLCSVMSPRVQDGAGKHSAVQAC